MDPATASWNSFYRLPLLHDVMVSRGDGNKKIWLTEFGAATGTDPVAVSEAMQATIIGDAIAAVGQWSWAGPLLLYALRDAGTNPGDREQNFGLEHRDFSPKPALAVLTAALRHPRNGG